MSTGKSRQSRSTTEVRLVGHRHPLVKIAVDALLAALIEAQRGRCYLCDGPMARTRSRRDGRHPLRPSLDHVRPLALGGLDVRGNLAAAHARCNEAKGARWPSEAQLRRLCEINRVLGWRA